MRLVDRAIEAVKMKHLKDNYVPVGVKCCKPGDEGKLYQLYAYTLLEDLLEEYIGSIK